MAPAAPRSRSARCGVVFGDIGTSPLYALQATLDPRYSLTTTITDLYGIISLIFWAFVFVVTVKYVFIVMRCDNRGEGGSLALYALINRELGAAAPKRWLLPAALFATALFFADRDADPAISVISAVEGAGRRQFGLSSLDRVDRVGHPAWPLRHPAPRHEKVGRLFGPVMLVDFQHDRGHGHLSHRTEPGRARRAQSALHVGSPCRPSAVLVPLDRRDGLLVTGTEALYADMGHFGWRPITMAWLVICMPALMLNYMGQAAMLLDHPEFVSNPFFNMVPPYLTIPLLVIATLATIIASQAVITRAFSITQQAIQLEFLPRMRILHTSSQARGQIYIPAVNWALAAMVAGLVMGFRAPSAMLPAYGLAVVATMLITTLMQYVVVFRMWRGPRWRAVIGFVTFVTIDTALPHRVVQAA